jgi:hypothetical protein
MDSITLGVIGGGRYPQHQPGRVARKRKPTKRELFFDNFADEIDIFDSPTSYPDWILRIREEQLAKITPCLQNFSARLKSYGLNFKIKQPLCVDGKYKFADIYLPDINTVLMQTSMYTNFRPVGLLSERAESFRRDFTVYEFDPIDTETVTERLIERLLQMAEQKPCNS